MSDYDETFCILEPCFVYCLPPRSSTQGYKAADWNLEQPAWTGRLKVTAKGETAFVLLEDRETGNIFAKSSVNVDKIEEAVEPVLDSSRYYVLKIEDERTQRHAFIGTGFHERDQAFEFKAALQDHQRRVFNERRLATEVRTPLPMLNLAMKEGETIVVDIKSGFGSNSKPRGKRNDRANEDGDDMFLPPPPSGNRKISPMSTKSHTKKPAAPAPAPAPSVSAPQPATAPTSAPAASDPFGLLSLNTPAPNFPVATTTAFNSPMSSPSLGNVPKPQPLAPGPSSLNPTPLTAIPLQYQPQTQPMQPMQPMQPLGFTQSQAYPSAVQAPQSPQIPQSYVPLDPTRRGIPITNSSPVPSPQKSDPFSGLVNF